MSQFTPTFEFETEFDGDKVKCVLRRLKRKHMAFLGPLMQKAKVSDDGKVSFAMETLGDLSEIAEKILPDCVVELKGLKDADGNAIKLETAIEEQYFNPLVIRLLMELIMKSTVATEKDLEKKSELPPSADIPGLVSGDLGSSSSAASTSGGGTKHSAPATESGP